jgi:hypothetical protein
VHKFAVEASEAALFGFSSSQVQLRILSENFAIMGSVFYELIHFYLIDLDHAETPCWRRPDPSRGFEQCVRRMGTAAATGIWKGCGDDAE